MFKSEFVTEFLGLKKVTENCRCGGLVSWESEVGFRKENKSHFGRCMVDLEESLLEPPKQLNC